MADRFSKVVHLPPLRITVEDLAQRGDEFAAQMGSGGRVDITYEVGFEDGTSFEHDSSRGFLANLDSDGEKIVYVTVSILAWTASEPGAASYGDIAKAVQIHLRDYGSDFWISTTDLLWGEGAVDTIKTRLNRYSPSYARVHRAIPVLLGLIMALPINLAAVAVWLEGKVTALLVVVVVLSLLVSIGMVWLFRQFLNRRWFAHMVILRKSQERKWPWLSLLVGAAALAELATFALILLK